MFKKFALYLGIAASLQLNAFAIVGGPFDGDDYNQLLDDRGIYQTALRFKNGSGYSQWGNNVDLIPSTDTGSGGGGAQAVLTQGTILNRSYLYYKGVTYFGSASGIVDHKGRQVIGISNGFTELAVTSSSTGGGTGGGTASATQIVVNNGGLGYTANTNWIAKITSTSPELRYSGTGELSIIVPDIKSTIFEAVEALINSADADDIAIIPSIIALASDPNFIALTGLNETIPMTVYGARKFFLSRR